MAANCRPNPQINMRDDFPEKTKDILAKRVGMVCSNPKCGKPTSGPREDESKASNIGVAAHITAASKGGPRFEASLSDSERSSTSNGIWLCQNCAKMVDNDEARYTVDSLKNWKLHAETIARNKVEASGGFGSKIAPRKNNHLTDGEIILVIDDDAPELSILGAMVKQEYEGAFQVMTFVDAAEGLHFLVENSKRIRWR